MTTSTETRRFPLAIATFCGAGFSPIAPGTIGSLAALPVAYGLISIPIVPALVALLLLFIVGIWASNAVEESLGTHDAQIIVIDEVVGQCLVVVLLNLWFLAIFDLPMLLAISFVAFRVFDIVKPWPVRWADQSVDGGWGVMLDDVIAALQATVVVGSAYLLYLLVTI